MRSLIWRLQIPSSSLHNSRRTMQSPLFNLHQSSEPTIRRSHHLMPQPNYLSRISGSKTFSSFISQDLRLPNELSWHFILIGMNRLKRWTAPSLSTCAIHRLIIHDAFTALLHHKAGGKSPHQRNASRPFRSILFLLQQLHIRKQKKSEPGSSIYSNNA